MAKDEFKRMYPDLPETQWDAAGNGDAQGWFTEDSVRVAEYYYIEHEEQEIQDPETGMSRMADVKRCMWCKVTGDTILEQTEIPCKYIPIIPVIGHELWLQGRRYLAGLVRNAKDAQRMYNYYLSANAENVALSPKAPFIGVAGQFETDPNWGRANKESVAYLEYDPVNIAGQPVGPPQRAMPPQASSAIMQAIQLAENDIMQSMGIYQPSLGAQSNEVSGRALFLRQKQADTNTFHYQDNLNRSIRQCGRVILDMIPKVYDRPRVARIIGEDGSPRTVKLNPNLPQASVGTDNPAIDSIFNPTIGQYDVVCDSGPSYATKRDEASQMMLSLTQANPSLFGLIGDLMVKNMDWPGAEEISRRLQAMLPPQIQQVNKAGDKADPQLLQAEQAMNQLASQMEHMSAEIQDLREKKLLEIQRMEREWYDSQTNRMKADVEVMKANLDINKQAAMDALMIMQSGARDMPEENEENEQLEQMVMQPSGSQGAMPQPTPQGANGPAPRPQKATRRTTGAMTKKPDIQALTGSAKPGETPNE